MGLGDRSYNIYIGNNLLAESGAMIRRVYSGGRAAVLSDDVVWKLYGQSLSKSLTGAGIAFDTIIIPHGESSKTLANLEIILEAMAKAGMTRSNLLIAFGGGVIGDLGGFAAGVYMRGISCVQIPTTLLSQVDSSVGGKTGVNLSSGKNLAGVFWQPRLVVADTDVLETLDSREFSGGMAEIIKYGAIRSKELFERLKAHSSRDGIKPILDDVIYICCDIKRDIVRRDEFDRGERMLLNFGHTLGHAIERLGGFETYTHGEAVAIGMCLAARYGERLGLTRGGAAAEIHELCGAFGLPVNTRIAPGDISPLIGLDKKASDNNLSLILLNEIGDAFIHKTDFEELGGNLLCL